MTRRVMAGVVLGATMLTCTAVGWTLARRHVPPRSTAVTQAPCARAGLWCGLSSTGFGAWDGFDGNVLTLAARQRYFQSRIARSAPGGRYFQARVDDGAVVAGEAGERSLLELFPDAPTPTHGKTAAFEGSDEWYHTSLDFPLRFQPSPRTTWNWVVEWHNWPDGICCANIALTVDTTLHSYRARHSWISRQGQRLSMRVMGGGDFRHPADAYGAEASSDPRVRTRWFVGDLKLKRGHWYDVLLHVHWSYRASRGLIQWWLDGRLVTSAKMPTLFYYADNDPDAANRGPGPGQAYLQLGYYRPQYLHDGRVDWTVALVNHAGMRRGPTRRSVAY
jgi:hypothetical protein